MFTDMLEKCIKGFVSVEDIVTASPPLSVSLTFRNLD
jgi:hypothetical protein